MPDDVREPKTQLPALQTAHTDLDMVTNRDQFELGQRVANLFANSQLIPAHLRGKPADCFIALQMARQLGDNPVVVMQNIYIVSGRAGWSATYMIARANRAGVFKGRITWKTEGVGDAMKVTATATLGDTGEAVAAEASMAMAKAEGWTKNAKYQTMPEHMLRWRSATMLIRLYAPEVMLGMSTSDELEDMRAAGQIIDVTPPRQDAGDADPFERAAAGAPIQEAETVGGGQQADAEQDASDGAGAPDQAAPLPTVPWTGDAEAFEHGFALAIQATAPERIDELHDAHADAFKKLWAAHKPVHGRLRQLEADRKGGRVA